jgi:hypothetical protein
MNLLAKLKRFIFVLLIVLVSFNSIGTTTSKNSNHIKGFNTNVLTKHTLSNGGGKMSGNTYEVTTSIGQLDAGHNTTGGGFQFVGGILAVPRNNQLFKDGFE